jgi:hypothetical protein
MLTFNKVSANLINKSVLIKKLWLLIFFKTEMLHIDLQRKWLKEKRWAFGLHKLIFVLL